MPKVSTATATRALFEHLGSGLRQLVKAMPTPATYESDAAFGREVDKLIAAALKAAYEGRQSNAQMRVKQQAARQGFSRSLARKVSKLPPVAT